MSIKSLAAKLISIPNGTYPAVVSGHLSEFKVNKTSYKLTCENGVRGFNIQDTVTVTDGVAKSKTLGLGLLTAA